MTDLNCSLLFSTKMTIRLGPLLGFYFKFLFVIFNEKDAFLQSLSKIIRNTLWPLSLAHVRLQTLPKIKQYDPYLYSSLFVG